ncbi:hydrogenase formation protein HypD [Opitutus sp. GAS368]|uniref:hydrogenase formation protein HypD n=1 Tax=Opitutus sp. GAS368 TaxID=1882749 RepID=UPI00087A0E79|nr:hydrogenase formation protein HypD [Opitutus sp. GAS368]SDS44133.1 Hydrogenase maturation protein HypD [Opitutus sp. GAS368]
MKYVDEYRDAALVHKLAAAIARATTRPWTIMEICGGQTHAIVKFGLDDLLPKNITLVHGPGCPVCVTSADLIDQAVELARRHRVILCSFGDMLRVPGNGLDLLTAKARGADVRIIYSPLDAVTLAKENPAKQVVFFAVGFETTAPANALAVLTAAREHVPNFSILTSHVLVPPAMRAILGSPDNRVQGFLAAGHVCTIMGTAEYGPIAREFGAPIIITGFEPVDILEGILLCVQQLESGRAAVENAYARAVRPEGNVHARRIVEQVFAICDRDWRGLGVIPQSGLAVRPAYATFDAARRFPLTTAATTGATECISGEIMRGIKKPHDCPAFGTRCTPECPLGAPMVSSEGACAAYHRYRSRQPQLVSVTEAI